MYNTVQYSTIHPGVYSYNILHWKIVAIDLMWKIHYNTQYSTIHQRIAILIILHWKVVTIDLIWKLQGTWFLTVLLIPMRIGAYNGAMSKWFTCKRWRINKLWDDNQKMPLTPNPAQERPPRPRASERNTVEVPLLMISAVSSMNTALIMLC